jgi:hypothetical protein
MVCSCTPSQNDGERHIPYLMLLGPEGTKSKMRAWAAGATKTTSTDPGGMIQEQLACGCEPGVFILYAVHFD